VLLPGSSHVGVSRRITDQAERERLRALLSEIPRSGGVIVRTAGEGRQREDFVADLAMLESLTRHILSRAEEVSAPSLLYRDLDLVLRAARDLAGPQMAEFWVDDADAYQRVLEFLDRVQPELTPRIKLYRRRLDLFEAFSIESELEQVLQPKVWLRSGGSLVINQTEALVAIDVNTGRYVGGADLEDTVFRINLEAAAEVARQIRLRDLGGIIVVDFIDMEVEEHRAALLEALRSELAKDRARTLVGPVGPFGLVQLTRKRTERSLERTLTQPCPVCAGRGRIKSPETMCLEVRRAVLRAAAEQGAHEVSVRAHPEVARLLNGEMRGVLDELRGRHGIEVRVLEAGELPLTVYDVTP
jgi:ribonuclease G